MGRTMPVECEHGVVLDWGDFGGPDSKRGVCDVCDAARLDEFAQAIYDAMAGFPIRGVNLRAFAIHIARNVRSANTEREKQRRARAAETQEIDGREVPADGGGR